MTNEELQAMRETCAILRREGRPDAVREALLAEVERLRTERAFDAAIQLLDTAEILALRAEVERLRAALENIMYHVNPDAESGSYRYDSATDACDYVFAKTQSALGLAVTP